MSQILGIQKRLQLLAKIAEDENVKMTQRLRALEEIGRLEARAAAAQGQVVEDDELAPDPMADLDEVERQRQKRAKRHVGTLIARRK